MYRTTSIPQLRITGLIELTYQDYTTSVTENGKKSEAEARAFQQRYQLNAQGYIIHPKLALYSADVAFRYVTIRQEDSKGTERDIAYGLFLTLLPQRPYSLDLYASRDTGTVFGGGTSTDITTNNYGATLRLWLKDLPFLKPKAGGGNGKSTEGLLSGLPLVTINFDHWDYSADNFAGKTVRDTLSVDAIGRIRGINTRYTLAYEFSDYSSPRRSFDAQSLKGTTDTVLSPGKSLLSTSFQYASSDITKYSNFLVDLTLTPNDRFGHMYSYSYYHFDQSGSTSDTHFVQGTWDYRFAERFNGHGTAYYALTRADQERDDSYGTGASLHYSKLFKDIDFFSVYRFAFRDSTRLGNMMENNAEVGFKTRKLKWGTIYSDYNFTYLTTSEQGDLIDHVFRAGVLGRGPGRAYWNLEAEYENMTNKMGGINAVFTGGPGELIIAGRVKTSLYSVTGEVGYPLGRRGTVSLRSNYTSGTTDSQDIRSYYYEARFNYSLLRNLALIAWWREGWDRIQAQAIDRKTREYEGRLYYRLRRVFLSLEYTRWRTEDGPVTNENSRLFLRLTRAI